MPVMIDVHVKKLIVLGAVHTLLTSGLMVNDLDGIAETKKEQLYMCEGEVTGVELQDDHQRVCVLEPSQNTSQSLNLLGHSPMQHREDALLRRHSNTVWLDVRMITNQSQGLDHAFALNVFNGTLLFLADTPPCPNDNITDAVQFVLKDDCDCQPKAHVPLVTPAPSPSADHVSDFPDVNSTTYQLCDGEITGVEFEYGGDYIVCMSDLRTNITLRLGRSVSGKAQHNRTKILSIDGDISRFNVRMIGKSTWELDPAYAVRLSHQTVLFIANSSCAFNRIINEDDKHRPVQFLLAGKDSCRCGSGPDPPIVAYVVLIAASIIIPTTITSVVVLAVIICKKRNNAERDEEDGQATS